MGLKLTVTSPQRTELGVAASVVFGVHGGSIGRGRNNDWVLPDPHRYLSASHARVEYRSGQYYIEDLSTNGLFVNDAQRALGRQGPHQLREGDRLRLGEYRILVSIDNVPEPLVEASMVRPIAPDVDFIATQGDIGAQLNIQELLRGGRSGDSGARVAVDAFGQPLAADDSGLRAFDSGQTPQPKQARLLQAMRRGSQLQDTAAAMKSSEAFYKGAGIDPKLFSPEVQTRILNVAGLLLRESLVGLKDLTRTQREVCEDIELERQPEDPQHEALYQHGVEELLVRLLRGHDERSLDAVQWLRDSFASARRHDVATTAALRTALVQFIARLDERMLSQWEKLPHLFLESFGRAYFEALKKALRPN
jgi:predicted component of type VI protein secretion system